jgi:branched-chain amino acid transport system ATP-binding protein
MHFIAALCEHVIVLDFGRKIAEGTPDAIRNDAAVREAYLGINDMGDEDVRDEESVEARNAS